MPLSHNVALELYRQVTNSADSDNDDNNDGLMTKREKRKHF